MNFHVVIPSRYASTRLPGKALLQLHGKPLIQYVHEKAIASGATSVVIATDDERIATAAIGFGAKVCMTAAYHTNGTDRLAEVVQRLEYADDDVIINVQGDEPLIPPQNISHLAADLLEQRDANMATLYQTITTAEEIFNPNIVKVVLDQKGYALYFSRAPIPWQQHDFGFDLQKLGPMRPHLRHVGLYGYRAGFIKTYSTWPSCELEQFESLEQLRVLWHGGRIHVTEAPMHAPIDVNTAEDLEQVRILLDKTL